MLRRVSSIASWPHLHAFSRSLSRITCMQIDHGLRKESKTSKVEKKYMHLDHGLTKESRPSTVELMEMSHILMSLATSFAAKSSGDTSFASLFSPLFSLFSPFLLRFDFLFLFHLQHPCLSTLQLQGPAFHQSPVLQ